MRILLLGLLVAACTGAPLDATVPAPPTAQVIYITPEPATPEPVTPEPTVRPTATPTAAPTAPPTVTPTEDATQGLMEGLVFLGQNLDFMNDFVRVWERAEAQIGDWPDFRDSVDELESIVSGHQLWLSTHTPHPCYAVAHSHWITAIDLYSDGIAKMQYGLIAPVTENDIIEGVEEVLEGLDWTNRGTEAMDCGL